MRGRFLYASRTAAKVDSGALQDGYQFHHHDVLFSGFGQILPLFLRMDRRQGILGR
ncbi:MAG: DUF763 domain-containing protein [Acidobacteria bacterium]|nr:DUF763 domain-containing protein [Acidobacteriota bacterium]